ncbi:NALCN channel auxiliary factor 1 isoform X1 [Panthera pardus]|uniref:NALCN channel auxiliary factor 1 isoform X1 n=1 Tax=Panthera pardus TaxID=9691 RepID=A0A9W2UGF3_PANPR|nr:NALCN channel auxiliary factor 1 isoform X1 [Panthera pardus]
MRVSLGSTWHHGMLLTVQHVLYERQNSCHPSRFLILLFFQIVYKAWLCSQYFEVAQFNCRKTIPCKQYCLEVQTRCPFILPDNDEVIYGGLSSFICTGLYETFLTNDEPECCDVRREERPSKPSRGTVGTSGPCHRTSLTVSSATRLCNSRLKLCVLVLILLHTVLTASATQNSTALSVGGINALEDSSAREE